MEMSRNFLATVFFLSLSMGFLACGNDSSPTDSGASIGGEPPVTVLSSSSRSEGVSTALSFTNTRTNSSSNMRTNSSSSVTLPDFDMGDLGKSCDKAGAKKNQSIMDLDIPLECSDGVWDVDSVAMVESLKCSPDGVTKDTSLFGFEAVLVCKDGMWNADSSATAAKNRCDKAGSTKQQNIMGFEIPFICQNGEWTVDLAHMDPNLLFMLAGSLDPEVLDKLLGATGGTVLPISRK